MILYHGSLDIIREPIIIAPNRPLDYGSGFYCTTSLEQATEWVQRRKKENKKAVGYVSIYEFDKVNAFRKLHCKAFSMVTDEEWLDFVMANRTERNFEHSFDIVYGPVANDRVYTQFALYEAGIISKRTTIAELKTYKLVDQYLFHTVEGLKYLHFQDSKII